MAAPLWKGRMSFLPLPEANFDHHLGCCLIFPFYTPFFPLEADSGSEGNTELVQNIPLFVQLSP